VLRSSKFAHVGAERGAANLVTLLIRDLKRSPRFFVGESHALRP
jgi:hypothetical protein